MPSLLLEVPYPLGVPNINFVMLLRGPHDKNCHILYCVELLRALIKNGKFCKSFSMRLCCLGYLFTEEDYIEPVYALKDNIFCLGVGVG